SDCLFPGSTDSHPLERPLVEKSQSTHRWLFTLRLDLEIPEATSKRSVSDERQVVVTWEMKADAWSIQELESKSMRNNTVTHKSAIPVWFKALIAVIL